jgi:hypothetical protein
MKKVSLILVLGTLVSFSALAQDSDLKPFKVDVSAGYAIPGGTGSKGGILFAIEPKYAVMPALSVGLRMEGALVARSSGFDTNGELLDLDVKASSSYIATGDYYFSENYSFRPFAGAGAGIFSLANASISTNGSTNAGAGSKFGGMIRAGIEVSHFRLGVEYNLIPKSTLDGFDSNGNPAKIESKNSYIGIKLGVCFGGGPR